jgi:pilus assembly protein CpaF
MMLMGMDLPLPAIQRQIASGLDLIIHLGRRRDKSRKLLEIAEVLGYEDGEIKLQTLVQFEETGEVAGKITGEWRKIHELAHRQKLETAGLRVEGY